MKKTKTAKAFAIFALLGIIVSIVGTGILVLTTPSNNSAYPETLTQEWLQDILDNAKVEATTVKVWTGETK